MKIVNQFFFIMYLIIHVLVILIPELITVSNGEDNYCMSDNVNPHYMNNIVVISEIPSSLKMETCMSLQLTNFMFPVIYII